MKKTGLIFLLLLSAVASFGYNYLSVGDPRRSWYTSQGTIELASLSVKPKGLFIEYGLYLTFSARGTSGIFLPTDSLEIVLNFDLPEGSAVSDSWLWVGDKISRAKILDKWTASSIYEGIVKRRRDPSILTKVTSTHYELRIFPLVASETRRVKITYLLPATVSKGNVWAALPAEILKASMHVPAEFQLLVWNEAGITGPYIVNNADEFPFVEKQDSLFGKYSTVVIPSTIYSSQLAVGFKLPVENGIYIARYQQGNKGIYQLSVDPGIMVDSVGNHKTAILLDFDASNTSLSKTEVIEAVKNEVLRALTPKDSFNLFISKIDVYAFSDKWVQASETNILSAFADIRSRLVDYSNLVPLFVAGIDFVNKNGAGGNIMLITNSDQYGDYPVANPLIDDIISGMDKKFPVYVCDYLTLNPPYYYFNNMYYQGNDYLNENITRLTSGSYYKVRDGGSLSQTLGSAFSATTGMINSFDMHTSLENGLCYSRYTMNGSSDNISLSNAVLQVGKYIGEFPLHLELSGLYGGKILLKNVVIGPDEIQQSDSVTQQFWTGLHISKLENGKKTNDIVNDIIFQSLSERVLSLYTSFLCLEDPTQFCYTCQDESVLTELAKKPLKADSLLVFPNPFTDRVNIRYTRTDAGSAPEISIYDMQGKKIMEFNDQDASADEYSTITWNGQLPNGRVISPGIYVLVYKMNSKSLTVKLIKR